MDLKITNGKIVTASDTFSGELGIEGGKIVKLSEAACKGCGCCVAACPSGAMEQKGFKSAQIMAEIDAALAGIGEAVRT